MAAGSLDLGVGAGTDLALIAKGSPELAVCNSAGPLLFLGIAAAANGVWSLLFVLPCLLVIRYGVIAREEAYLERKFGQSYRAYKARVRRWL